MTKKKLIAFFTAVAIICVTLAGCSNVTVEKTYEPKEEIKSMFIEVERAGSWRIVYHEDTRVMYAVSFGSYNLGTFTLLVNPDGTPMLWGDK